MQTSTTFSIPEMHESFSINKISYTKESLQKLAFKYQQEGEVYQQEIGSFLLEWLDDKDHVIVQTSGSTGTPKKIKVLKTHMINSAKATGKFFKLEAGTTALVCLSAAFIAGKMMLVRAMVLGWKIECVPPKINPLDAVYKHYDFCAMVPLQLDNSINRLHLIKKLIVGGGSISENLRALLQGIQTKVYETYGMTETVTHIAARRVNPKKKEKKEAPFFKALPNITLQQDERNCLVIKAPLVSTETIVTNDIVALKTYKKFHWKGRFDNVINSGGIKLYPEEIETKLQVLIAHRFFISSVPDDALGEKVVLILEDHYDPATLSALQNNMQQLQTLSKYERPKAMYCIPQFLETGSGKVQRTKTLALALETHTG